MKIAIYYGGRGLIDDPTLYVINKMQEVLEELHVTVERYHLYELKNTITTLPKTLKEVDGIILATTIEWFGIGGYMQQFLDACWLYGDKEKIASIYMCPVVMSTTYGEREGKLNLENAWEILGGKPCSGLCGYIADIADLEGNEEYNSIIEKKTENFYRMISKKAVAFPNSSVAVKRNVLRTSNLSLTPQESEQLSEYVSNDNYVKKQKEDIEELASLFKGMLGEEKDEDDYVERLKSHFFPMEGLKAVFRIDLVEEKSSLIIDINDSKLNCYRGTVEQADVTAKVKTAVFKQVLDGTKTFQSAFMSGELSAQGNFKILRNFDTIFRFQNI